MSMNTFVCVHVLQDVPPANLNRDDNGTPKTASYGGVERLRVSSQAWKRATRRHFEHNMAKAELGVRTRRLHGLLREHLLARGFDEERAASSATAALKALEITPAKPKAVAKAGASPATDFSSYLLFAGRGQLERVADLIAEADGEPTKEAIAAILGSTHPLDVALFGRMVADMTALNVDAAAQVAHAISTHAAATQFDYFTAVDDEQESDEAGAAMIGLVEFNSGTLYRYAVVGLEQLVDNMGDRDAAIEGVRQFITSFVGSLPSGKQNTFAAHTRPALVMVEVRADQPVSLVSAFEKPVVAANGSGYMAGSQAALADHHRQETQRWGDEPLLRVASFSATGETQDKLRESLGESATMASILDDVSNVLHRRSGRVDE